MKKIVQLITLLIPLSVFAQYQPHVIWDRSGETDSSAYGYEILPLGDQNNDGFADWAVKAQGNGGGWHGTQQPYLEFFQGAAELPIEPFHTYQPDTSIYTPGFAVDMAGDINGDGFADWLVSLWERTLPANYTIQIFLGGPGADYVPDMILHPVVGSTFFPIGDFNGDSFDDLYWSNNSQVGTMYFGGSPTDTIPDWGLSQPPPGQNQTRPYAIGDFNGNGASDFICYNPNPPYNLAVFMGGANPDTVPAYFWSNMMWPIGGVKSLNGDSADEFLLGLGVYYGRDTLRNAPDAVLNSEAGNQAVSAGDFNHDGYNDLILLTPTTPSNMFGALDLHLGHPWLYPDPAFEIQGSWPDGLIGIYSAAGLGDVNGDSIDDIAIGAWDDFAYLGWRGRCIIIAGDDSLEVSADNPRPEIPVQLAVQAYPNPFNSETTIKIEVPLSGEPVRLTVFDVLGREVQHEVLPPYSGKYNYHFDAQDLPSGLYFALVQSASLQKTQKLMLLK